MAKPTPGLYLVATPIGNAADITLRALAVLRAADAIACEDTRVTRKLLTAHGIGTPMISYHEHNAARMRPVLLDRLGAGETIALVSDAGTPLISDPGYKLVRDCVEAGLPVTTLPGACAPVTALVLSGLPSDRFLFAGFLPPKSAARRAAAHELATVRATLVFFESKERLAAALADFHAVLGDREAAVARELTKMFEEVRRGRLSELAAHYEEHGPPKGEIVIVVGPPAEGDGAADEAAVDKALAEAMERMSVRDAASEVAAQTGWQRRQVYARALELSRGEAAKKPRAKPRREAAEPPPDGEDDGG
ncbi:16S rRNA methyltransferase [Skermanella stibiiresistens SB22]|uniref:Ribosomal RNA small subunit methyltransferase I n=1 Tax=Skermanella stibiiresistens SB22 TaxID=1385369 RepID=W9H3A2_9PROT|nr:16S rRNA (cytidine(1402)-2'-O)-methyltransferase [Skermanella stibiiresistens]EWY40549.1 16S rRNA methyltransferase [Skermanella stibiiresistens SB22]